jgi:hypothetical protein
MVGGPVAHDEAVEAIMSDEPESSAPRARPLRPAEWAAVGVGFLLGAGVALRFAHAYADAFPDIVLAHRGFVASLLVPIGGFLGSLVAVLAIRAGERRSPILFSLLFVGVLLVVASVLPIWSALSRSWDSPSLVRPATLLDVARDVFSLGGSGIGAFLFSLNAGRAFGLLLGSAVVGRLVYWLVWERSRPRGTLKPAGGAIGEGAGLDGSTLTGKGGVT